MQVNIFFSVGIAQCSSRSEATGMFPPSYMNLNLFPITNSYEFVGGRGGGLGLKINLPCPQKADACKDVCCETDVPQSYPNFLLTVTNKIRPVNKIIADNFQRKN